MKAKFFKWVSALLLLAAATTLIAGWQLQARRALRDWNPDIARRKGDPIPVRTVQVGTSEVQHLVGGTAVTIPSKTATLAVSGRSNTQRTISRTVKEVNCWQGGQVKQGDVLVTFEPQLFELAVQQRRVALKYAEVELDAFTKLHAKDAASLLEMETSRVKYETAKFELAMAEDDLKQCIITSPIDGIVDEVNVVPGMHANDSVTLVTVHSLDPLYVQMDYPVERLDVLELGQEAEVVLDSFPKEKFHGKVIRIAPVVNQRTRVLPVIIELPNPDQRLKAGITAFARVATSAAPRTTVPQVAVIEGEKRAMVFRVTPDNRAEIREVETGHLSGEGEVEIRSGLEPGDQVVVYGQDSLQNNDPINPDWRGWTGRRQ